MIIDTLILTEEMEQKRVRFNCDEISNELLLQVITGEPKEENEGEGLLERRPQHSESNTSGTENNGNNEELPSSQWYTKEDYKRFRDNAKAMSRFIKHQYRSESQDKSSYAQRILAIYYSCLDLSPPCDIPISLLSTCKSEMAQSLRGFEGCISSIRSDQKRRAEHLKRLVLSTQVYFGDSNSEIDERNDWLREMSREHTESSELFAAFLGKLDAYTTYGCLPAKHSSSKDDGHCNNYRETTILSHKSTERRPFFNPKCLRAASA